MDYQSLLKKYILEHEDYRDNKLSNLDIGRLSSFADWLSAQKSAHPTMGICAAFQAFIYAVKSSILTAFRHPPQRK